MSIDDNFPIRDKDGKPLYRGGQREVIEDILSACNDYKYIALEGPTGCGKSVINYTVLRELSKSGKVVYLTPQKVLQDQIGAENWEETSVVKGKSGYVCNFCPSVNCNYEGDEYEMCNNTKPDSGHAIDFGQVCMSIGHKIDSKQPSTTCFNSIDDLYKTLDKLVEFYSNIHKKYKEFAPEDIPRKYRHVAYFESAQEFGESMSRRSISCHMGDYECPKKSSKARALVNSISIMNPDIMFNMNRNVDSEYNDIDALVIDECHGFDGVMNRIFGDAFPLTFLKSCGVDLTDVAKLTNAGKHKQANEVLKGILFSDKMQMILNTLNEIRQCLPIIKVSDVSDLISNKGRSPIREAFGHLLKYKRTVDPFEEFLLAYSNSGESPTFNKFVMDNVRDESVDIVPDVNNLINIITKSVDLKAETVKLNVSGSFTATRGYVKYMHAMAFRRCISSMHKAYSMISMDDDQCHIMSVELDEESRPGKYSQFYNEASEHLIRFVIVKPGVLAFRNFYSKAKNIIFTTGTWIYPHSMYKSLGINEKQCKFLKMKSTFEKNRRPVFVIDDKKLTNFSKKSDVGGFSYKTSQGTYKFNDHLSTCIRWLRAFCDKHYKINPNIIVHSHSFDIAKRIAEFGDVDDDWLINMQSSGDYSIRNFKSKVDVRNWEKMDIMSYIDENRDSGKVIVSPSVTEGVDFKHGRARAQIILKHPIPNIIDPYIRSVSRGVEDIGLLPDSRIISRLVYTTIVQQYGRVMRDRSDWGITLIIDQKSSADIYGLLNFGGSDYTEMNAGYLFEGIKVKWNGRNSVFLNPGLKF